MCVCVFYFFKKELKLSCRDGCTSETKGWILKMILLQLRSGASLLSTLLWGPSPSGSAPENWGASWRFPTSGALPTQPTPNVPIHLGACSLGSSKEAKGQIESHKATCVYKRGGILEKMACKMSWLTAVSLWEFLSRGLQDFVEKKYFSQNWEHTNY